MAEIYLIQVANEDADGGFENADLPTQGVMARAAEVALELATEKDVATQVVNDAGVVVHEVQQPSKRVIANKRTPYSRLEPEENLPEGFVCPDGYVPAYTRGRNGFVVVRHETNREDYLVVEAFNDNKTHAGKNTKETSKIMVRLGKEYRAAKEKAAAEAKAEADRLKAEAKRAKDEADAKAAADKKVADEAAAEAAAQAEADEAEAAALEGEAAELEAEARDDADYEPSREELESEQVDAELALDDEQLDEGDDVDDTDTDPADEAGEDKVDDGDLDEQLDGQQLEGGDEGQLAS